MNIKRLCMLALIPAFGAGSAAAQTLDYFKTYGPGSAAGGARGLVSTRDGNFAVVGNNQNPVTGVTDMYLVKTKPNGDTLWTRSIGTPGQSTVALNLMHMSNDNDMMIAGFTEDVATGSPSAAMLTKVNVLGSILWQKTYPIADGFTLFTDMKPLNDGFILTGIKGNTANGAGDGWLVKTNFLGDVTWEQNYGGNKFDDLWQVERTPEGGFLLGGSTASSRPGTYGCDAWLIKTDRLGNQIWAKYYGTTDSKNFINSLTVSNRSGVQAGYVFTGAKTLDHSSLKSEMYFAKIDSAGNILWDKSIASDANDYIEGYCVEQTYDGGFYLAGTEYDPTQGSRLLTVKTDPSGNIVNKLRYGSNEDITPWAVFINTLGDAYIAGGRYTAQQESIAFLAHIQRIAQVPNDVGEVTANTNAGFTVFPNPATDNGCTVASDVQPIYRIQVKDITGRILRDIPCSGTLSARISLDGIPKGNVLIHVFTGRPGDTGSFAPVVLKLTVL